MRSATCGRHMHLLTRRAGTQEHTADEHAPDENAAYRQEKNRNHQTKWRECSMKNAIAVESPIGVLLIETNGEAITEITLPGSGDPALVKAARSQRSMKGRSEPEGVLARAEAQLEEYFAGQRTEFDLPLELDGTEFQRDVWLSLAEIPYGKTISYAELARPWSGARPRSAP